MLEWDDDHGPTDYNNGIQLCGSHHRYCHEGKWKIRGNPDQELQFIRPDGVVFTGRAPSLDTDMQQQLFAHVTTSIAERVQHQDETQAEADLARLEERELRQQHEQEKMRIQDTLDKWKPPAVQTDSWASEDWGDPAA